MKKIFDYLKLLKKYNSLKNEHEILQNKYEVAVEEIDHHIRTEKALRKQLRELRSNNRAKSKYKKVSDEARYERS